MNAVAKLWVWRMALRDGRRGFRPLLLSMLCVVLAVASVVVAFSFRENVQSSIRAQSKSLLGADLALGSREPFSPEDEALFRSIGGEQSRQIGFASMVLFPRRGDSRLMQVRAVSGGFPYYGAIETAPPVDMASFHRGPNALVDENVMLQFDLAAGDSVKIGDKEFRIAGRLRKIPGETLAFSLISPRVYIPLDYLERTGLLQKGSLVRYRAYFKLPPGTDADLLVRNLATELQRLRLEADTVSRRAASIAFSVENLSRYLKLAVFVAVLLAGVGVASVIHVYTKAKTSSVAVLRCIGAGPGETLAVYLIQVLLLTAASTAVGAALGMGIQFALPQALKDFLPLTPDVTVAPSGIAAGLGIGLGTALLFALIPLLPLRKISPLLALRASFGSERPARDKIAWLPAGLIVAGIAAYAVATTGSALLGLWFSAGVLAVFGGLMALARGGSALMRKLAPAVFNFAWRQGLANLYRPNNQTTALILAIGVGTFLLVTLYSVHHMLVREVAQRGAEGEPNVVLFDVQRDQRRALTELLDSLAMRLNGQVPIVTMRLGAVKGRRVEELRADRTAGIPQWALRREYRSTYRAELASTEAIVQGEWQGRVAGNGGPIPVSVEKGIAETLKVGLGDELLFEVQGVPLRTRIASLRAVDWQRVQPNFFVVFPEGVLENAPQFYAVVARAESNDQAARLQRAVVERFPNVSVIDLRLVLSTLNSILAKISGAIRFVALFTIVTGAAVLVSAVLSSRSQRLKETILLRALGAPRRLILKTIIAEYLFLGALAGLAGSILGIGATVALGVYFFAAPVSIAPVPVIVILLAVVGATVAAGAAGCWGIFRRPALEALRAEA